jgi:hypothetical protein
MLIIETKETFLSLFDFSVVAGPVDNIVLVFIIEHHLCVHEIFYNLFPAAILQEFGPSRANTLTLHIVMHQGIVVQVERGSHVNIGSTSNREEHQTYDRINPCRHNRTLAQAEMPNLDTKHEDF